ncbi:MAG: LysR family transcriptional regulator, partial [Pseudomonadota bacterium]
DRHFFGVRCDDQAAFWRLVCAGCGVGAMQARIGDAEPLVERLDVDVDLPPLPVWLAAQEDVRRVPRVARVWEALVEGLSGAETS